MIAARRIALLHGVQSSAGTWWRMEADLRDLGHAVVTPNLPGHGGRPGAGAESLASMATDVAAQLAEPVDLLVGHSLGALVALTLAAAEPALAGALLLEDPPAIGPHLDPANIAADIERAVAWARAEPDEAKADLLRQNPLWARPDASHAVASRRSIDVAAVTTFLRRTRWDLPGLVRDAPVPVHLLLADEAQSATTQPGRSAVIEAAASVTQVESGHSIHRDRPGVWIGTALRALVEF